MMSYWSAILSEFINIRLPHFNKYISLTFPVIKIQIQIQNEFQMIHN